MKGEEACQHSLSSSGADPAGSPPAQEAEPQQPPQEGGCEAVMPAHSCSGNSSVPTTLGQEGPSAQLQRRAPAWPRQGRDGLGLGPGPAHPRRAGTAVTYLSRWRPGCTCPWKATRTRGLSSSAWSTDVAAGKALAAGGSPPPPSEVTTTCAPTLPPPTTRASMRAAHPRDPGQALQEQRPWGQAASGGRAFKRPGPLPLRAQRRPRGGRPRGLPTPSCPADMAARIQRA